MRGPINSRITYYIQPKKAFNRVLCVLCEAVRTDVAN